MGGKDFVLSRWNSTIKIKTQSVLYRNAAIDADEG